MGDSIYEYSNFKVDTPRVDDGWYLVKDGMTYRVDVPINKMRFTKSVNILTGEVYYPSNADRIRAMTDEELAEWLSCNCTGDGYGNSAEDWLDWLKEEVVSND